VRGDSGVDEGRLEMGRAYIKDARETGGGGAGASRKGPVRGRET